MGNRLEAFSDGVSAIMAPEREVPHAGSFEALLRLWPVFMGYALSFIYVRIYWNKLQCANHPLSIDRIRETK